MTQSNYVTRTGAPSNRHHRPPVVQEALVVGRRGPQVELALSLPLSARPPPGPLVAVEGRDEARQLAPLHALRAQVHARVPPGGGRHALYGQQRDLGRDAWVAGLLVLVLFRVAPPPLRPPDPVADEDAREDEDDHPGPDHDAQHHLALVLGLFLMTWSPHRLVPGRNVFDKLAVAVLALVFPMVAVVPRFLLRLISRLIVCKRKYKFVCMIRLFDCKQEFNVLPADGYA